MTNTKAIRITSDEVILVKKLKNDGMTVAAIAREVQLSRPTIYKILKGGYDIILEGEPNDTIVNQTQSNGTVCNQSGVGDTGTLDQGGGPLDSHHPPDESEHTLPSG